MSFIQSAFIHRISVLSLIRKLKVLGYSDGTYLCNNEGDCLEVNMVACGEIYSFYKNDEDEKRLIERSGAIDCGTNQPLFLALAALRDDSDYMQWFVMNFDTEKHKKGDLILSTEKQFQLSPLHTHKATASELVEHFKQTL